MALGKRGGKTGPLFVPTSALPRSAGHPFYRKLNELLTEARFDREVEALCEPYYAERKGRPSIPPGVYFRMLLVGYFEGIDSQRGIAWRCADSIALREFLGVGLTERSPDHSSLTVIRKRLPTELHESVFALVLGIARDKKLLDGKTLGVDATLLEANAAMKSIVRKDTAEDWKAYLRRLAQEAGIEDPSDDDLRRFDKGRGSAKKVSNEDWESKTDPDSRISKLKDGRTHMAYKAEHAVDLGSQIIVAATIQPGSRGDTESLSTTLTDAQAMLATIGHETAIEELVADKGYHSAATLTACAEAGLRTYISPKKVSGRRRWTDKSEDTKRAVLGNQRRALGDRGRRLSKQRGEKVERTFAHVCDAGGARRSWLRGFESVTKRYLITVAAHNLGRIMFTLFGIGKPRALQGEIAALAAVVALVALLPAWRAAANGHFAGMVIVLATGLAAVTLVPQPLQPATRRCSG